MIIKYTIIWFKYKIKKHLSEIILVNLMVFISIIVPFVREERYLKDCLDSLANQLLSDEEVILVLNGVDENLSDLLNNYQDKLNIIIKSFDNEVGVGKARNEALKIASGKYVYFIDSDDYIYEDALAKLVDVAKKTDADLINGERISTYFIRERFNEEFEETTPLKKGKLSDQDYSFKLLVSENAHGEETLSVLHSLIKRDRIGDVKFREDKIYHIDYNFMLSVLDDIESFYGVENALYGKRISDDFINAPSLRQIEENSFSNYYGEYKNVLEQLKSSKYDMLKREMAQSYYKYYCDIFSEKLISDLDNRWRGEYLDKMIDISKDFKLIKLNFIQKREINALQSKNLRLLNRFIKLRKGKMKFKRLFEETWRFKSLIYFRYFNKKPIVNNKIIFESFNGEFYSDNPKYIYQYLNENYNEDFEFVWVINDKNVKIPGNPKKVKRLSLKHYKELATSKYWVINTRQSAIYDKRNSQIMLSTWHGTPLKRLGFDMGNVHLNNPRTKESYKIDSAEWKYLISPNRYTTEILKRSFAYEGEVLETGYPRNDILHCGTDKANEIKNKLGLPSDKKVILYAPTWRDVETYELDNAEYKLKLDLDKLKESLGDEYIILIRTHYLITDNLYLGDCDDFAFNVSQYDDIAELYLISDILITDYSSVFFDFANLKRPILFYTYDLDEYENELRGFYIDIRNEVPGPLLKTTEEVIDKIINIDSVVDEYREKYDEFYERFCSLEDGNASGRVVERIWGNN